MLDGPQDTHLNEDLLAMGSGASGAISSKKTPKANKRSKPAGDHMAGEPAKLDAMEQDDRKALQQEGRHEEEEVEEEDEDSDASLDGKLGAAVAQLNPQKKSSARVDKVKRALPVIRIDPSDSDDELDATRVNSVSTSERSSALDWSAGPAGASAGDKVASQALSNSSSSPMKWACANCTLLNSPVVDVCEVCSNPRSNSSNSSSRSGASKTLKGLDSEGTIATSTKNNVKRY